MLTMQLPWWEFVLRAAAVYLALLLMVRASGKRTIGQFTPFDLVVVILLSEAVSESLHGSDDSLPGGLIAALTLLALDMMVSWLSARSRKADQMIEGRAVLVGRDGQVFEEVLRRERVPATDMERALRAADCTLADMQLAVLEANGEISIIRRRGA